MTVHRRHLGADKRSVVKEIKLIGAPRYPQTTSVSIAGQIAAAQTTPSGVAIRGEALEVLEKAIASMSRERPRDHRDASLREPFQQASCGSSQSE